KPVVCRRLGVVARDKRVAGQLLLNTLNCAQDTRIIWTGKPGEHHQQRTSVDGLTSIVLDKTAYLLVPALLHDFLVDLRAAGFPFSTWSRQCAMPCDPTGTIKGDPAHHTGVEKALLPSTDLPDTFISFLPVLTEPGEETTHVPPEIIGNVFVAIKEVDRIQ